jgi:RNA polymerase sigma-70 factor, ECF subfamily
MALADVDVRALIEQHRAGDTSAFDEIVRLHSPSLLAAARRRLGSEAAAQDAVQETFLRAYRAMPRFDGDLRLAAWLHRICSNVCFDEYDRRNRDRATFDRLTSWRSDADDDTDDQPDPVQAERQVRLDAALKQIPPQYREALELHYGHDQSFRDISTQLGVSEENARARASRGRKALRKLMAVPAIVGGVLATTLRRGERPASALTSDPLSTVAQSPLTQSATQAATQSGSTSTALSHSAQFTQFVTEAAPSVTRIATELAPTIANKTPLITTAVAAATAVAVPVAANQVADRVDPPAAPAAATAAPTAVPTTLSAPLTTVINIVTTAPANTIDPAMTKQGGVVVPAPGVDPAAPTPTGAPVQAQVAPTTSAPGALQASSTAPATVTTLAAATTVATTAVPTTTAPVTTIPKVTLKAGQFSVSGSGQRFDVSGSITVSGAGSVPMSGVLTLGDPGAAPTDPVSVELSLSGQLPSGESIELRIKSRSVVTQADGSIATSFNGPFRLTTSAAGYPSKGSSSGSLSANSGSGSLDLTLS